MTEIQNYKGYLGNPNLKRSGVSVNWTPDLVKEYAKCSKDPIYFAKKYVKIINVDSGLVQFKPYAYQSEMIDTMHKERFSIIATARQAGKTTAVVSFILHYILAKYYASIDSNVLPGGLQDVKEPGYDV